MSIDTALDRSFDPWNRHPPARGVPADLPLGTDKDPGLAGCDRDGFSCAEIATPDGGTALRPMLRTPRSS